jgi:hypothetical protein
MNKTDFEKLREIWELPEKIITAEDLQDKSDRTLLYGYTCDRGTWHVYIQQNHIYAVIYLYSEEPEQMEITSNSDYVPNKRLYPECCDFEFCKLLKEVDVSLPFTTWTDRNEQRQYWGKTL